jgi:hypothetical protein
VVSVFVYVPVVSSIHTFLNYVVSQMLKSLNHAPSHVPQDRTGLRPEGFELCDHEVASLPCDVVTNRDGLL